MISGLRFRLVLLVALAAAPALGFMLYDAAEQRRLATPRIQTEVVQRVDLASANYSKLVEAARQLLSTASLAPAVRARDAAACGALFAELLWVHPQYCHMGLVDRAGNLIASTLPHADPLGLGDRACFRRALQSGRFAIGDYQIERSTGKAWVNFAHPVLGPNGEVESVLFVALDLEWLSRFAAETRLPEHAALTLMDRQGVILWRHPDPRRLVGRPRGKSEIGRLVLARHQGVVEAAGLDGERRVYAFRRLGDDREPGVYVSVGLSKRALFAQADAMLARSLAGFGLAIVLLLLAAWFGGDLFVVRRIRVLVDATQRLRVGDLKVRSGISHEAGEIGELARSFDEMAETLEQREAERRRAQEALWESRELFRTFMDNSPAVAFMKDEEGRMVYVNRPYEDFFRTTLDQVRGKSDFELWPDEVARALQENDRAVLAAGKPVQVSETVPSPDGTPHHWLALKFPVTDPQGRRLLGGVAIDISERLQAEEALRKSEEQLRQAQKMEAVGRLAGGVAHDFNNMLTAIMGYSQLMRRKLRPDDPARHDIEEILRAAERAASLTRQLLAFSRRQVLEPRVLDLNAAITDLQKMLRRLIGEDIDLVTAPGEGLGRVKADPGQLQQVIMNLVVNARDAMPQGGKLTIETANVDLDEDGARGRADLRPGRYVMLVVSDTGCGMTPEVKVQIFDPFFTTKEKGKGTGLGLSMVHGFVKQSDGHIEVCSEPGRGATFRIFLPRVEAAAEALGKAEPPPGRDGGSETVLLVEDESVIRRVMRESLELGGYRVLEARDSREAIDLCDRRDRQIDLLLTDVVMPLMSGPELAQRVTAVRPGLRVLYVSGYADRAPVHQGMRGAGTAFLQKPFTPETLVRKVREVLDEPEVAAA